MQRLQEESCWNKSLWNSQSSFLWEKCAADLVFCDEKCFCEVKVRINTDYSALTSTVFCFTQQYIISFKET